MKILKNRFSVSFKPIIFRNIGKIHRKPSSTGISDTNETIKLKAVDPTTPDLKNKIKEANDRIQNAIKNRKITDEKVQALIKQALSIDATTTEKNVASLEEVGELMILLDRQLQVGPTLPLSKDSSEKKSRIYKPFKGYKTVVTDYSLEGSNKRDRAMSLEKTNESSDDQVTTKAERLLIDPNENISNSNDSSGKKSIESNALPPDSLRGIEMSPIPINKENGYLYGVLLKNLGTKPLATEVVSRAKGAGFDVGYFQRGDTASIEKDSEGGYLVRRSEDGKKMGQVKIYDTPSMLERKEGISMNLEKTPVTKPDYLFGVLNENFDRKEALNILNRAARKGFDINNFKDGETVSMENGTLIKWGSDGKEKEWVELYGEDGNEKEYNPSVSSSSHNPTMDNGERLANLSEYSQLIEKYANLYGINPALGAALIHKESSGKCEAVSSVGACGLTQVMTPALKDVNKALKTNYTMSDLSNPEISIKVGFKYLSQMMKSFKGEPEQELLALTAYNHGIGNTKKILKKSKEKNIPVSTLIDEIVYTRSRKPNTEAREYAKKILKFKEVYAQQGYGPRKIILAKRKAFKNSLKNGPRLKNHKALTHKEVFPQIMAMGVHIKSSGNDYKDRFNRRATTVDGLMPQTLRGLKILTSYVPGLVISGGTEVGHSGARNVATMRKKLKAGTLAGSPTHSGGRKLDFPYSSSKTTQLMAKLNIPKTPINTFITKKVNGIKMTFHPEKDHLDVRFHA